VSRVLTGEVRLPADAPSATAALVLIEVRDTSLADAPSVVVAAKTIRGVTIHPGGTIPFAIDVPNALTGRALSLRVHVNLGGANYVQPGDLLTTANVPVPEGTGWVAVAVAVVR
jgi:putative lipoprotein